MDKHQNSASLVIHIDEETQTLIDRAAELAGSTLEQFLIQAATKEALAVEIEALHISVSNQTADRILQHLENPKPASLELRKAALKHRQVAHQYRTKDSR
ncbi:DUF1778 domain-containing protein [Marinobacter sp. G11]|jgi:Uncharacterized protein conserved in bacteria|uniref:type II toxin-antitoxin system TacA family antitoxin n=1 Tax=Marinobacter sp. G11 TaxID=2903522 RepID=UPI001E46FB66|nr:DUF1778 domain-containing protein [Marinobacter sp. G11]MCE0760054.1 DUF1778 domain-containing protein [Marinobacter sp. G11]